MGFCLLISLLLFILSHLAEGSRCLQKCVQKCKKKFMSVMFNIPMVLSPLMLLYALLLKKKNPIKPLSFSVFLKNLKADAIRQR